MAGTVDANVNIKINSNAKEVEKELSDVQKAITKFYNGSLFENIDLGNSPFNDAINESTDNVSESFNSLNIDTQQLVNSLANLLKTGKLSESTLLSLGASVGVPALAITTLVSSLKIAHDTYKKFIDDMKSFGNAFEDIAGDGIDAFINSLEEMCNMIDDAIDKLQELSDVGKDIQDDYFALYNTLGSNAGGELNNFANALETIYGLDATGVIADMQKLYSLTAKLSDNANDVANITESMYIMAQNMSKAYNQDIGTVINSIKTAVNTGSIRNGSALFNLLDSEEVAEFKKLNNEVERTNYLLSKGVAIQGIYDEYIKTSAGRLEILQQQWNSFLGNLGQLALGIYSQVAPVLTKLLQLANALLTSLMTVFNINVTSGTDTGNYNGMLDDMSKNLNKVSDAADKAKRKLASFDDVIQINEDTKTDKNNNGIGDLSSIDTSWLNKFDGDVLKAKDDWEKFIESVKNAIERGDFYEAGHLIADKFDEWLSAIDWNNYKGKATEFATNFADFIKGLISNEHLFSELGEGLAECLNTIATFLYTFADEFGQGGFRQLGKDIGITWNSFWDNLDTNLYADTAYKWFMGLINTIQSFLYEADFSKAGFDISEVINSFFSDFNDEDLDRTADTVIRAIDNIFIFIQSFLDNLDVDGIKEKLKELIIKIMQGFNENSYDWGSTLNELITTILDTASELLATANKNGLLIGITKFFYGLDISEIFMSWLKLIFDFARLKINIWLNTDLIPFLTTLLKLGFFGIAGKITVWISDIANETGEKLKNKIKEAKNIFDVIPEYFSTLFTNIYNNIVEKIKGIIDFIKQKVNSIKSAFSGISLPSISSGFSFNMPKLATGGIVTRSTIANIGEDGAEAIVPLERNTEWIDKLSSSIASKIGSNNSNTGGQTVIDMSAYSKNFYTRSEMLSFADVIVKSLSAYGVNISIAY